MATLAFARAAISATGTSPPARSYSSACAASSNRSAVAAAPRRGPLEAGRGGRAASVDVGFELIGSESATSLDFKQTFN
ncbi:hypothetical protein GCM10010402_20270 [Actinomadura luteofluorescens]